MQSEIEMCPRSCAAWLFIIVSLGVALLLPADALAFGALLGIVAVAVFVRMSSRTHEDGRGRMLALAILLVLQVGFWVAFFGVAALASTVAQVESGRALELLVVLPLIVLAPVAGQLWKRLDARGLEPSPAAKFSLGFLCLAASCTCLAACVESSPVAVGLGAVGACLVTLMLAALMLGPACVEAIFELAPPGQRRVGLISWALAYVFARAIGTWAHTPSLSYDATFDACLALGFGAVATAVLSSFMWHGLQTLASTHGPVSAGVPVHLVGGPVGSGSPGSGSLGTGSLGTGSLGSGSLGSSVGSGSLG
jgi:dipeptide/tripeptide permease